MWGTTSSVLLNFLCRFLHFMRSLHAHFFDSQCNTFEKLHYSRGFLFAYAWCWHVSLNFPHPLLDGCDFCPFVRHCWNFTSCWNPPGKQSSWEFAFGHLISLITCFFLFISELKGGFLRWQDHKLFLSNI